MISPGKYFAATPNASSIGSHAMPYGEVTEIVITDTESIAKLREQLYREKKQRYVIKNW